MPIHVTTSTVQSLSNKTFVDYLSTTGIAYANGGNSSQWNSSYTTVYANSASWLASTGAGGGGGAYYYLNRTSSAQAPTTNLPVTAHQLGRSSLSAQTSITTPNISQASYTLLDGFVTDVLDPYVATIPAGIWAINVWAYSDANINNPTSIEALIYTYDGVNAPILIATSDAAILTNNQTYSQHLLTCLVQQTTIAITDRIYIELRAKATASSKSVTVGYGNGTPTHVHTTLPSVGGTGLVKAVSGVLQSPASFLIDADVASDANISQSKINGLTDVANKANSAYSTVNAQSANNASAYSTVNSNSATWNNSSLLAGGTTNQILVKNSNTSNDVSWKNKRTTLTLATASGTSATITSNALSADQFVVSLNGTSLSATFATPANAYDAQIIMWNVRYTTNIAAVILASDFRLPATTLNWSVSANKMDIFAAKYNQPDGKWDVISFAPGYSL